MLSARIKLFKTSLVDEFAQKKKILPVTKSLVKFVDDILISMFHKHQLHGENRISLIAVGSYGRKELQLYSDIDLIILHKPELSDALFAQSQTFIQQCWDVGLNISHQITTPHQLADLAESDLSVISSVMDMRVIAGCPQLAQELAYLTQPLHMWTSDSFFHAKVKEQAVRYAKYGETAYNLEPNVKNGPGGLRDLQVLLSIGKRHFRIKKLSEGIICGFFNDKEYEELVHCLHFLWKVRFALHSIAQKNEEQLIFDHQIRLAEFFNYQENNKNLAIELFMKDYFKIIKRSRELNDLLLQWFAESIVEKPRVRIQALDAHFQLANRYIEIKHPLIFQQKPICILQLFFLLIQRPDIQGVRANTIRLLRKNLFLINKNFRENPKVQQLFLEIFNSDYSPYDILHRMNRYGVLGRYLKSFSLVTGQMQYDLFHVYTVDQHTLFVIRNLGRFLDKDYASQFPLACRLMPTITNKSVLYLAALFHDIAKGRGGDHSELGAKDAEVFSTMHSLAKEEKDLLIWLIKNHLLMSKTAQRFDIYDPKVINEFCKKLPKANYLEYLYLLTVADICGTNPSLWTTWKDSLLKELFRAAQQKMHPSLLPINEASIVEVKKNKATQLLNRAGFKKVDIDGLWASFKSKYFLHESPKVIALHTKTILNSQSYPIVMILPHHSEGGTEVFIYTPHRDDRFAIATTILSNHRTTIQEASILTCNNGYDLDTFIILDEKNEAFINPVTIKNIKKDLRFYLNNKHAYPPVIKRRVSRTKAHFNIQGSIQFSYEQHFKLNQIFIVANDRPGLLANISRVFVDQNVLLHQSKIATIGERVEDVFIVSNTEGTLLTDAEQQRLSEALYKQIIAN